MMKPDAALLADPALSNREIARRVGHNHHYVAGYRAALAATGWVPAADAAKHPGGVGPKPAAPTARSWHTPLLPGRTVPFEAPALNRLNCWALATPAERTKFVDGVGLHCLFAAAPRDHHAAFCRRLENESATVFPAARIGGAP